MSKFLIRKSVGFSLILLMFLLPQHVLAQNGFQTIVHSVNAEPIKGKVAYTVKVYFSVLDNNGIPVKELKKEDFSITEDSQKIQIDSVDAVLNESSSLILVMDTSGSMLGQGIVDMRNAASNFLQRLGDKDQVAVMTFNDTINTIAPFGNDHNNASDGVKQINATNGAGTCLYDAAYQAVEMASSTPPGRRAIVVFTDGKDETASGTQCSFHAVDDVLDLAKTTGTPIYTLGMGSKIDEKELKRIAASTGGSFLSSRKSSELEAIFTKLYEQLNNEYVLIYKSIGAPGPHTLTIEANYRSQKDQSTFSFNLPALPTTITITSPADGETLEKTATLKAKLLTQGDEIASVEFAADGVIVGKDISEPYEIVWDLGNQAPGQVLLEAVAIGKDGAELARTAVKINIPGEQVTPAAGEDQNQETLSEETGALSSVDENLKRILMVVGSVVVVGVIIFIGYRRINRRGKKKVDDVDEFVPKKDGVEDVTIDGVDVAAIINPVFATLTVEYSDDPASIGQQYTLDKPSMLLGRSIEEADILFSKLDQSVSRRHVILEKSGNDFILHNLRPTYGTFLKDQRLPEDEKIKLNDNDEIRLGSRVKLRFHLTYKKQSDPDATMDNLNVEDTHDSIGLRD